jgi:hypothetical protein
VGDSVVEVLCTASLTDLISLIWAKMARKARHFLGGYFSHVFEVVHFSVFIYLLNGGKLTLL